MNRYQYTGRFAALNAPADDTGEHAAGDGGAATSGVRRSRAADYARMLRTLIGNIDGMVYRCRPDLQRTIEFVSAGCHRVTGHRAEDLLHNARIAYEQITHPEDRLWVGEAMRAALLERRAFDLEYRIVHADGHTRWVWDRGIGLEDGGAVVIEGLLQDVTERKRAFEAMHEAERRYRSLFENAIEGIFRTTVDGEYLDANPALAQIYGYASAAELMASIRNIARQLYVDPGRREEFMRIMRDHGAVTGFESQVHRRNGEVIWICENARAIRDGGGSVLLYEGTVENITERKRYQARLEHQATHDALTGLANRSLLQDRLERAIGRAAGRGGQLAVVFVDLDHFKLINDTLGHHVGDALLRAMAGRLQCCVRDGDTVARVGGDEFVLLLDICEGGDPLAHCLERMLRALAQPWAHEQREFHLTGSIGVALYPDDGRDPLTLLKHADSALYRAKDAGRNNFQFFTSELTARMTQRLDMEARLRRALEREQFELHYQPRVDLASGLIVGAEALVRWRSPEEGLIPPARFITLAEETGLIVPLGTWVMREACRQLRAWQQQGILLGGISVNVSPQQFRQGDLARTVAEVLQETGLSGPLLELELTESMMMQDAPKLARILQELKGLGVCIAIDDFGTGYSNLGYLKRFPVDRLKVDRSFVLDVPDNSEDAAIVRSIIALGHALGLRVVAEGVESAPQEEFLRANGCDEVQGYRLGRPQAAGEFAALIRQQAGRTP